MASRILDPKNAKNSKLPTNYSEPLGIGGWPLISTWINHPSLGSNGLHCIVFLGERGECLDLNLDDLFSLLEKLCYLAC